MLSKCDLPGDPACSIPSGSRPGFMKFSFLSVLALAALSNLASGTVVNIDFGNSTTSNRYVGQAAAADPLGGATATWNPLVFVAGTNSSGALVDSTNTATGIALSMSNVTGSQSVTSEAEVNPVGGYETLMRDYLYVDAAVSTSVATATGQFTGLVVGATYDLYFYGQGQFLSPTSGGGGVRGQNSYFEIGGTGQQTGWDGVVGGDGDLDINVEFVKFTVVAANGGILGGVINFDLENVVAGGNVVTDSVTHPSGGSRRGVLNAIQLVHVVPEPSSALLGLLGAFGLLRRRR